MKIVTSAFLVVIVALLAACSNTQNDPAGVTPSPATPADAPQDSTTEPPARPTSTILPVPISTPSTEPLDGLEGFVAQLQAAVVAADFEQMAGLMHDPFAAGPWRSEWSTLTPQEAISQLQSGTLPSPTAVQFSLIPMEEVGALLGQPPESMLGPEVQVAATLHSTGWGPNAADEAILFVSQDGDQYRWQAMLYTSGEFSAPPVAGGRIVIPAGLIYQPAGEGIFTLPDNLTPQQLLDAQDAALPNLQVSPDTRRAAYLDGGQLWIIDTMSGERQSRDTGFDLAPYIQWADANTLFLGIWLDPQESDGPNIGHLATYDVTSGAINILDEERLSANPPDLAPDGRTVAFDVLPDASDSKLNSFLFDPDSGAQRFVAATYDSQNEMLDGSLINPAWSPDGRFIAWLASTGDRVALQIFDLSAGTAWQAFDWDPARFGGPVPSPVWSPDSRWIALETLVNAEEGSGIWLIEVMGDRQSFVAENGHNPLWIDFITLVFTTDEGPLIYDMGSGAIISMSLAPGSVALSVASQPEQPEHQGLIPVEETNVGFVRAVQDVPMYNGDDESYEIIGSVFGGQTALVTGQSAQSGWWRVICPDDTVGDCWLTNDPAFTEPLNDQSSDQALPDPADLESIIETLPSPDGRWLATAAQTEPVITGDSQQFHASLTVSGGDTSWSAVDEWRPFGQGYSWPVPFQWSADSRLLYYTNRTAIDGCGFFSNGSDLHSLDVITGETAEIIAEGVTFSLALSPEATMLAYSTRNDQGVSLVRRDLTSGDEQSVLLASPDEHAQTGQIFWSTGGDAAAVTVIYDACQQTDTSSIVLVDAASLNTSVLVDHDDRSLSIQEWPANDQGALRLIDRDRRIWRLDIATGDLALSQ